MPSQGYMITGLGNEDKPTHEPVVYLFMRSRPRQRAVYHRHEVLAWVLYEICDLMLLAF